MSFPHALRNTVYQLTGRALSVLFGIFALGILTRYLGTEQFGWYTTVMTFLQFFAIIADFGLTLITTQMISEPNARENHLINNIFTLRLMISVVLFGAACALIWFMPYNNEIKWGVLAASGAVFFISLQNILQGLFQKHLHMEKVALGDVLGRAAIFSGFVIAVFFKMNLMAIFFVHAAANMLQFVLLYFFTTRYITLRFAWHAPTIKKICTHSWPIAVSMIFNLIYLKADTLILSLSHTQTEVGLYGAAYRVIEVLSAVPVMLMGIILPLLTYYWSANKMEFKSYFQNTFDAMALMGLPLVVGGIMVATPLMRAFAGADFATSGAYLQILLLALLAIFFGALSGHTIVAINKQRVMVWGYIIDALISFILYLILIPPYGARAAAWITVFSEVFILLMTWYVMWRESGVVPRGKTFAKIITSCAIMGIVLYITRAIPLFVQINAGAAAYIGMIFIIKALTPASLRALIKPVTQ
ncbi:MAG: flippase [Candidatus Magasanikbacteria bacterium]|nr:flippase [Candidatus Magasanikbacteria bacterium]